MATTVILQDPDTWAPLINVTVHAIDADTDDILDEQVTDLSGYATFEEGDFSTERYFFRPLITRTRTHLLVAPPFGIAGELYGIDSLEQYVDGRTGWTVMDTGAPASSHGLVTMPTLGHMFHIDLVNLNNFGDLYRSLDDGVSWAAAAVPVAGYSCAHVQVYGERLWTLWINEPGDNRCFIYYSDDFGDTYTLVQTILTGGLGSTFALKVGIDPLNSSKGGVTRVRPIGNGVRYFAGLPFPSAEASGVEISADANVGTTDGLMLFSNGFIVVGTSRGTGGSSRVRLHRSTTGAVWTVVFLADTLAVLAKWTNLIYGKPIGTTGFTLFAAYQVSTTSTAGLLRSTDHGATWEELTLPTAFSILQIIYDPGVDALYVMRQNTAYYRLPHASTVAAADIATEWETYTTLPVAAFQAARLQNVTLVQLP